MQGWLKECINASPSHISFLNKDNDRVKRRKASRWELFTGHKYTRKAKCCCSFLNCSFMTALSLG